MKEWCGVVGQVLGPLYRLSEALQLSAQLLTLCFTETLYVCIFSTTALENRNVTTYFVFVYVYVLCVH